MNFDFKFRSIVNIIMSIIFISYILSFGYGVYKNATEKSLITQTFNENLFNENTTGWQDFKRMSSFFDNLFLLAFLQKKNAVSEFWAIQTHEYVFETTDEITMRLYETNLRNGLSTRGGLWGNITNVVLYSAYSFGNIMFWLLSFFLFFYYVFPGKKITSSLFNSSRVFRFVFTL
jgi:hypothetical protein